VTLRDIHVDTDAALNEPVYRPLALVEMAFESGAVRAHSGVGPIVWEGNTFTGVSWLGKIQDWQEGESLESYGIQLELSGLEGALVAVSLGEHYRGRGLKIWIAFLDDQGQIIGEPVGPWRWRMSTLDGEFTGKTGKLVLSAGSRMAWWEKDNVRRYTDEDQRAEYPDDYICEFVSASAEREIEF
jgi:hypothetical protein